MSHPRAARLLTTFPTLVLSLAAVIAPGTAHAQSPTPTPSAQTAPPADAPPAPGYEPMPGYQPPPGAPAYGSAPAGYPQPAPGQPSYFHPPVVSAAPQNLHDGFYLRLHIGGSYVRVGGSDTGTFSGPGVSFGAALGGVVAPDVIVYGTFFAASVSDPTFAPSGGGSGTLDGVTLTMVGFGGGVAYYLPNNVYVAGALATMKFALSETNNSDNRADSHWGFGLQGLVGKEWWVSQDWGIGVAGEVMASSMKDAADETFTGLAFGLLFSATYN